MMKKIYLAIFALALVLLAPTIVYGAQSTRTLRPGNVYEFTGRDTRVISHINVTGTGRYDIVAWDSQGEITRFGTGTGRFSVSGTGGVAITPHAPLTVSFDSSRLRLHAEAGSALHHITIPVGATVSFANSHDANVHVRTSQVSNFDYVFFNRVGNSTGFAREVRLPQLSIPAGGSATITAALRETTVYFPSRLNQHISAESLAAPAIYISELFAGQVYTLANTGTRAHNMRIDPLLSDASFFFEYVARGRDGHVTSHGDREGNQLHLSAGQSISITPVMDGELYFPYAWLRDLNIGYGVLSPRYQTFRQGTSLTITNTDPGRTHSVFISCPDEEYGFVIDYTTLHDDEVTFNTRETLPGNNMTLTLQPGAQTTITILEAEDNLAISFPDIPQITSRPSQTIAIVRHELEPGESVYISFECEEDEAVRIIPVGELTSSNSVLDYVRYFEDEIESYGTIALRSAVTFTNGQSALITNPSDEVITLRVPYIYLENGLELTETDATALFRMDVTSPIQILNRDRLYNHRISVQNETRRNLRSGESALEYVQFATGNNIAAFGQRGLGHIEIPADRRIVIAPVPNGIVPTVMFPAEWYNRYFRITDVVEAPLYRITLRPGQRVTITNNYTRNDFIIQNNSSTTAAGFVFGQIARNQVINPQQGVITIPAREEVIINATSGADLELWFPRQLLRQVRIRR